MRLGKGKLPARLLRLTGIVTFAWIFLASCATVDYLPPTQGTSAELQQTLKRSLEESLTKISFDPSGKTVDLHVHALGAYRNPHGLERYVKSLFQEWVVGKGGKVGGGQLRMDVFLPVLGATATRRDLSYRNIPLYYSERFLATGQWIVVVRDEGGRIGGFWQGGHEGDLSDIYLMRILGPFDVPF